MDDEPELSRAERKALKKNKKAAPKKKVETSESESESEEEVVRKVGKMNVQQQQQQKKPAAKVPAQDMTRKERFVLLSFQLLDVKWPNLSFVGKRLIRRLLLKGTKLFTPPVRSPTYLFLWRFSWANPSCTIATPR